MSGLHTCASNRNSAKRNGFLISTNSWGHSLPTSLCQRAPHTSSSPNQIEGAQSLSVRRVSGVLTLTTARSSPAAAPLACPHSHLTGASASLRGRHHACAPSHSLPTCAHYATVTFVLAVFGDTTPATGAECRRHRLLHLRRFLCRFPPFVAHLDWHSLTSAPSPWVSFIPAH